MMNQYWIYILYEPKAHEYKIAQVLFFVLLVGNKINFYVFPTWSEVIQSEIQMNISFDIRQIQYLKFQKKNYFLKIKKKKLWFKQ